MILGQLMLQIDACCEAVTRSYTRLTFQGQKKDYDQELREEQEELKLREEE